MYIYFLKFLFVDDIYQYMKVLTATLATWVLGTVLLFWRWKMLSERPKRSASSSTKLWDPPCWSERRRRGSGGATKRRIPAERTPWHNFLAFGAFRPSAPPHECLCPSAWETAAGKTSEQQQTQEEGQCCLCWSAVVVSKVSCIIVGDTSQSVLVREASLDSHWPQFTLKGSRGLQLNSRTQPFKSVCGSHQAQWLSQA